MDQQALRPDNIPAYIKREETEQDIEQITEEEKILAKGAETKFWVILKTHINNETSILEQIADSAIENGVPLEEIGRNTIVISQVKGVLNKIFNVIEDAREAVESGEGK